MAESEEELKNLLMKVKEESEKAGLKLNIFWLCWIFFAVQAFSTVASRGYSSFWCTGFSLEWLLLLQSAGSRCMGSGVAAHGLQSMGSAIVTGLVAPLHVKSSCPGIKPVSSALAGDSYPQYHQGSPWAKNSSTTHSHN